ncbi:DUF6286 domain-containing protein [Leucobacter celer]|jgi:hypothetical protein|uniref:DUF6286 domain-containing protein n=1 Tax=Leucobacter celer TaxID=668625 RepID=UPI0006A7B865|nr:DUF6286 domain-containing protein [Leucobacter celer]
MTRNRLYRRVIRRESHSARSAAVVIVLAALVVVAAWLGTEIVLHLLGAGAILLSPVELAFGVLRATESPDGSLAAAGAVLLLIGAVLLLCALLPGRRGKHSRMAGRTAILVDDRVIASGIATRLSNTAGVPREQIRVSVGRGSVEAAITPISGVPVDRAQAVAAMEDEITEYDLTPRLTGRVRVGERGLVGA